MEERLLGDVWTDVPDAMHLPAHEPTGYPTQKPERLLERVVLASTDPGDLVLDPFAGSGTTLAVAQRLGRRWIGIDSARGAVRTCRRRLIASASPLSEEEASIEGASEGLAKEGRSLHVSFGIYEPIRDLGEAASGASPRLRITCEGEGDAARLIAEVEGYDSSPLTARLDTPAGWREALDCVLVDPAYDGKVFRTRIADAPAGRRKGVRGRYEVPRLTPGTRVAMKLVDVLGDETLVVESP